LAFKLESPSLALGMNHLARTDALLLYIGLPSMTGMGTLLTAMNDG
jgi:hypothetical protein